MTSEKECAFEFHSGKNATKIYESICFILEDKDVREFKRFKDADFDINDHKCNED